MAKLDPQVLAHLEWIGFVRPTGLVVSAPAMVRAGAILDRRDTEGQRLLSECAEERVPGPGEDPDPHLPDFQTFAATVLGWSFSPKGYAGTGECPIPSDLEVPLPDYGETLRPDYAVRERDPSDDAPPWQLLVRVLDPDTDFDQLVRGAGRLEASPHSRMERLLRETRVAAGLLFNGRTIRLISAPRGESSGWVDFHVADMLQTAGRPICSALRLLLSEQRLLALPRHQRLAALLADSRRFQNEVSERLGEQVLHGLYELLRGLQAAHDASGGELLREPLSEDPDEVYRALLTMILRLVFVLYAEERDMLPEDETFLRSYSLGGLYERLREDAALHPDTMDQRYGAWAQLLVLFRMIHDGAAWAGTRLPPRHGVLFDPDRYPFLEGRRGTRQVGERITPPLVGDGTVWRLLDKLLVLDGERISYRALDVEQIGSVYETMMGFRLEIATGRSVAIKPQKRHGAPDIIDLEETLAQPQTKRAKWIQDATGRKLSPNVTKAVAAADTIEDLRAALASVVDHAATPDLVPKGAMVLQPSPERRRTGSHYTPRALTEPIVRTTLEPILARLRTEEGAAPTPGEILDLKVCDPAMGSGAFLVEACRQLGEALVEAWHAHGEVPEIPPDEDEVVYARRLVAQRCLYGVDRNPVAVDLAKMSLWLVTLARDHSLTFLDHALRHGDSLVGLTMRQIENFHWDTKVTWDSPFRQRLREHTAKVAELRNQIRGAGEDISDFELRHLWDQARFEADRVRLYGDLVMAAFFEGDKPKAREERRAAYVEAVVKDDAEEYRAWLEEWRHADPPLAPFHWELEFPEVFGRENPGFDAIVGNPPFMGGHRIWGSLGGAYRDYLKTAHPSSGGKAVDLVAHFFRAAFNLLRAGGASGLLATNTVAQGDTREAGLREICRSGGTIYCACRAVPWPGWAAVYVSRIHVIKGSSRLSLLDNEPVPGINSFLFPSALEFDPLPLKANAQLSFRGSMVYGMGFTFDDSNEDASTLAVMHELLSKDPRNWERIFPFVSGEDLVTHPRHEPNRYIISFGDLTLKEASRYPDLLDIVRIKVKPDRDNLGGYSVADRRREYWWQYGSHAAALDAAIHDLPRCLAVSQVASHWAPVFQPTDRVFSHAVIVFPLGSNAAFCVLQARPHETWSRFFGSSMEDRLRYTPSDCFETFAFPEGWETHPTLEAAGEAYYTFRADLMARHDEGLTKTYNRFHDPDERSPDIAALRELHAAMDRAVLDAYGWEDIPTDCEFLLDSEIDEEEWGNKKKPYRYRWPDEIRDEVLARLLALNATRAAAESRSGATASESSARKRRRRKAPGQNGGALFR